MLFDNKVSTYIEYSKELQKKKLEVNLVRWHDIKSISQY